MGERQSGIERNDVHPQTLALEKALLVLEIVQYILFAYFKNSLVLGGRVICKVPFHFSRKSISVW